jgi:MarR-like DNA-binding transcriptional regulator SgrR of sgrS sRNA
LIGERLLLQLKEAGVSAEKRSLPGNAPVIELEFAQIQENDFDVFRYHLLKTQLKTRSTQSWFDEWDQLESSGKLVPLLIYKSRIAIRKNIQGIQIQPAGFPDFANCWILQKP